MRLIQFMDEKGTRRVGVVGGGADPDKIAIVRTGAVAEDRHQ